MYSNIEVKLFTHNLFYFRIWKPAVCEVGRAWKQLYRKYDFEQNIALLYDIGSVQVTLNAYNSWSLNYIVTYS